MPTCSKGRVALVGDAGYCPGPAVGASTSLAIAAYEAEIGDYVNGSRALARTARTLIPATRFHAWAILNGARLASRLPAAVARRLASASRGVRLHNPVRLKEYRPLTRPAA